MKTKTMILVTIAVFLFPGHQKAQSFNSGISLGASTASVKFSDLGNSFTNTIKGNNIMGFEGGVFGRLNLGPLFIKPMVLVSYQGGTATFYNTDGSTNSSKFNMGSVEVPVLFGIRILGLLRIEAGPVYNWIYATQFANENSIKTEPSGLGYRVGANVEFGIINLGLAYQGLTNNSTGLSNASFASPSELIFTAALCFGNK